MTNTDPDTFQIPLETAEAYEANFVPALFAEWAPHILEAAQITTGQRLLDVACGTGIVARTAAPIVGPTGHITGVDLNPAMLTVARRVSPDLEWRQGPVDQLPFDDHSFDAAVCQMALMFFPDRQHALQEMARVTRPGGHIALVVPAALHQQPAYRVFVDIAARHAGPEARVLLATYWNCGDLDQLTATITAAGLRLHHQRTRTGTARFDSPEAFVATEVEGSPLIERIDDPTYAAIRRDTATALAAYTTPSATFEIPLLCHIVAARVP